MGVRLKPGDTLTMLTSGGGGFGPPWERDADLVRTDVLAGRVSSAAATTEYGVVFFPETDRIDEAATAACRDALAARAVEAGR
jgi:N-methylhydantoinase B